MIHEWGFVLVVAWMAIFSYSGLKHNNDEDLSEETLFIKEIEIPNTH